MELIVFCFGIILEIFPIIIGTTTDHYSNYRNNSVLGDKFTIPKSLCRSSGQDCAHYGALNQGKGLCRCKCPSVKATFATNDSDWSCVDDRVLRYKSECAIKLMSERDNQISTLSIRGGSLTSIVGLGEITGQQCDVDMIACRYQCCNGTWFPLKHGKTQEPSKFFKIINRQDGRKFLHLRVLVDSPPQHFYGRVIKLEFTSGCRVRGNKGKTCLLIKLQGHVNCEAPKPERSPSISPVSTVVPTRTVILQPMTTVTSSTVRLLPTKSVKSPSLSITVNHEEIQTSSTYTVLKPTVKVKSGNSRPDIKMEDAAKVLPIIVAAAVSGGIIILIAFFLIAKYRR